MSSFCRCFLHRDLGVLDRFLWGSTRLHEERESGVPGCPTYPPGAMTQAAQEDRDRDLYAEQGDSSPAPVHVHVLEKRDIITRGDEKLRRQIHSTQSLHPLRGRSGFLTWQLLGPSSAISSTSGVTTTSTRTIEGVYFVVNEAEVVPCRLELALRTRKDHSSGAGRGSTTSSASGTGPCTSGTMKVELLRDEGTMKEGKEKDREDFALTFSPFMVILVKSKPGPVLVH